jgi:hypothetical protein
MLQERTCFDGTPVTSAASGTIEAAPRVTVSLPREVVYSGSTSSHCRVRFWSWFSVASDTPETLPGRLKSVVLPLNWVFKPMSHCSTKWVLLDESARLRAIVLHHQREGSYIQLCRRYNWQSVVFSDGTCSVRVVDGEKVLFETDSIFCRGHPAPTMVEAMIWQATYWLNEHFPDWEDPTAYWSDHASSGRSVDRGALA